MHSLLQLSHQLDFGFRIVKEKKEYSLKDATESSSALGKLLEDVKATKDSEMWWIEPVPVLRWDGLNPAAIELALKTKRQKAVDKIKLDICKVLKQILPRLKDLDQFTVNENINLNHEKIV